MNLTKALAELSSDVSESDVSEALYELVADEDDRPDPFLVVGCACFMGLAVFSSGFDPWSIFPVEIHSSTHFLGDVDATLTTLNSGPIASPETLVQAFKVAFDSAGALQGLQLAA